MLLNPHIGRECGESSDVNLVRVRHVIPFSYSEYPALLTMTSLALLSTWPRVMQHASTRARSCRGQACGAADLEMCMSMSQ